MSKHTPGPWLYNPATGYIRTETPRPDFAHGQVIAKVMAGPGKRADANARLIAAAPAMAEALMAIAGMSREMEHTLYGATRVAEAALAAAGIDGDAP